MESHWSSFLIVAAVFTAFSGVASVWGRLQRRKRERQQAVWQALLQGGPASSAPPAAAQAAEWRPQTPAAARQPQRLPPDPTVADSPGLVSDSDSRRAALDEALDRMGRPPAQQPSKAPTRAAASASPGPR